MRDISVCNDKTAVYGSDKINMVL